MQNAFWQSGSDSRWFLNNQTKQLSRPWKLPSSEQTLVKTAVELAGNPATVRSTGFFFSMKSCSLSTLATTIILALFLAWLLLVCTTTSTSNTGSYTSLTTCQTARERYVEEGRRTQEGRTCSILKSQDVLDSHHLVVRYVEANR